MQVAIDTDAASTWVFPQSNDFAVRKYQVDICKQALMLNTLVCLPTGLGKTLIAAVVMYNYYRWFPRGKVIFLAPTKPLVNQQIVACHNVMGIPEEDIAHLEGSVAASKRETLWKYKRVFFCTPQTLMNDLSNGRCDARSIVCIVLDEAHRATGQYAYTTVVQEIITVNKSFRILALSATPGSDARKVQAVINNLLISHIEIRAEDDPEIVPYTHLRQIDIVVCMQGAYNGIKAVREHLNVLMQLHVDKLNRSRIVDCESAAALNILYMQEAEAAMRAAWTEGLHELDLLCELNCAVEELGALLRCRKVLCDEGLKALLEHLQGMKASYTARISKGSINAAHSIISTDQFQYTLDLITRACADPRYLEKRQPKLSKLKEILADHFARHGRAGSSTRALVFSQLRSTVHEIKTEISEVPGIKAHEFVGQGTAKSTSTYNDTDPEYSNKGLSQADQARILRSFNEGHHNVLVATSIAEEGLDIAEVDLIVLFEAVSSPIRLVQRCGRTGRKRSGKVVMLVSQGAEEEKVEKSHDDVTVIAKALRNARNSMLMYAHNPVMLPPHLPAPQMVLKDMEVAVFRPGEVAGGLAQMHKSSSVGNLKTSSIQQPVRLNPAQNRAAKVVPSTSSSVAGSSYGNDGQWSFNSDSAPPPAVSSSGADDEGWQWLFNDSSLNDQATTAGREQEHQLFRNSSSSRSSNNHGDRNSNNYLSNHSAAVHAGSVFSACMTEEDMFVWGFPISTKPTTTPGRPAADSENWLSAGTRSIGASSSATARASLSSASSSTAATSQQRSAAWMKTRDVEIVDLLDDSPLKPVPVHRPASPSSAPQLCDRMPPAVALPPPLPRAAPATSSMNSCAAVWNHANLSTSQQLPRLLGSQCQQQPGSQLQSQSQKLGASQVASQGAIRFKSLVRSTSRSVSFFTLSDDDTDDDDIDVGGNGVEPSQSPVVEVSKVAAKDINVSSRAANVAPQLNSPVSLPTSVTAPVDAPAPMQDSPLSQVLPPVRKKTARIADTQENFDSQCSVSDPENANDSEQQTSVRINGCVSSSAKSSAAFDPFQQDSGELTAASEDDSESEEGGAREADDVEGGGDEEDEWRDTANACCACLDWRSEEEDPIIFCDGLCGSCIHVSCYGLLRDGVPEGDFFCESCAELKSIQEGTAASSSFSSFSSSAGSRKNHGPRKPVCGLCYRAGGLMKRGTCGTWTHPVCVLFTPELTICPRVNRPDNLANLSKDRKYLCCEQCRQHGGACVQCAVPECLKAVHPYCAYGAGQQMILRIDERTEASSYELFCPKHKERYAVGPGSGEIVSSRISLVEDKISRAKKDKNCSNKALLQAKIGIADDAPRGRLLVQSSTSRSSLKSGVTFVSTTPKATGKAVRFGTSDSSPGDLVDTAEKPPQDSKKRHRESGRRSSTTSMLELISKSRKQPSAPKGSDDGESGGACGHISKKRKGRQAEQFFDLEAALSGSDSGDESDGGSSDDSDSCLSGTFINDGAYTQQESQGGAATQYGMYLAVNNYHMQMASPDDFARGKVNISALVRGPRARRAPSSSVRSPSQGSDVRDSDVSILPDTPEYDSPHEIHLHGRCRGQSHHNGDWRNGGSKRRAEGAEAHLDLSETASSSGESSEDEVVDFSAPIVPATAKTRNASSGGTTHSIGTTKGLVGSGKENAFRPAPPENTFFSKLASRGGDRSDDSDLDAPPKKKPFTSGTNMPTTANNSSIPSNARFSSGERRPPLFPLSPNVPKKSAGVKLRASSPEPSSWNF